MDLFDGHTTFLATSEAQFQVTDFFDNFSVPMELKDEVGELLGEIHGCFLFFLGAVNVGFHRVGNQPTLGRAGGWLVCVMFSPIFV